MFVKGVNAMSLDSYEDILKYRAAGSIIAQADKNQGDSANREGVFVTLTTLAGKYPYNEFAMDRFRSVVIPALKVGFGTYRRGVTPGEWYTKPDNFTRDQRAMLEMGMAVSGMNRELFESMLKIILRGGFHQNTRHGTDDPKNRWKVPDIITPGQMTTYIRGLATSKLAQMATQPILMLLDLGLLVDIGLRGDSHDIDNMLATKMLFDYKVNSTFVSRFAMRKYITTDFLQKIKENYAEGDEKNGIAPMADLFKEAYQRNGLL